MPIQATVEQKAACEAFSSGHDLALIAGAGTGKTSTLILMGSSTRRRGMYVAFNRSIAGDARKQFGANVECRTAHSLAFRSVGRDFQQRLGSSARTPARQTAQMLGIHKDLYIANRPITVSHQARLTMGMVRRFCFSSDQQVMARHLGHVNGLDPQAHEHVAQILLRHAHRAWQDICSSDGRLRFEHDHYMKMWALTKPVLPADFILLDEAQDTNPVLEEVFLSQSAQRICVGDPAQQIYAWRSARDVMTGFPAQHLELTQSFRFGPAIAAQANRWLRLAESRMQLSGHGPADSRIGRTDIPDAILCRGNSHAMAQIITYLKEGIAVALAGDSGELTRLADAADELKAKGRTSHPELFLFGSWQEVQEYVETDSSGQDLKAIVDLIDTYGTDQIRWAVSHLTPDTHARVTVSTVHKAKGREWPTVRIGNGFDPPAVDEQGVQQPLDVAEARLIYVAVSRARTLLDPQGVAWLDDYEAKMAPTANHAHVAGRPVIDLNLTAQLRYDFSPISRFMETHLPNVRAVAADYQKRIADLPFPIEPLDTPHPDWTALGHTIDYRLRLSLGGTLGDPVNAGIEELAAGSVFPGAPPQPVRAALHSAGQELVATIDRYLHDPSHVNEHTVTRLCFVAAYFEDLYRSGQIRRFSMLTKATADTTLADLIAAVPTYVLEDIDAQMRLAEQPFAAMRRVPAHQRICGPAFAGSADIGGADADFIIDGLLLDCKATRRPRDLGRDEIYQLAGYLLLDYPNQYAINRVGLYLSRQAGLITWTVADFLRMLGASHPLPHLRSKLHNKLRIARVDTARTGPPEVVLGDGTSCS